MSGNRYVECPRCLHYADKFDAEVKGFHKTYYGKIDADEYDKLRKKLKKIENPFAMGNTVRLDYEAYFNEDGKFEFYAYANCEVCGLQAGHKDDVQPKNQSESKKIFEEKLEELRKKLRLPKPV